MMRKPNQTDKELGYKAAMGFAVELSMRYGTEKRTYRVVYDPKRAPARLWPFCVFCVES